MESPQSTGLVRSWAFRITLLAMGLSCFVVTIADTHDRLQLSMYGVPATIQLASKAETAPTDWAPYEGRLRALFYVKVKANDGKEFSSSLFLPKEVVEKLLNGEQEEIIFAKSNPRRFLIKGEPFPSFGFGWSVLGLSFFAVFLYSLKLR